MTKKILQMKWLLTTLMLVAAMLMPTEASAAITPSKPTSGDGSTSNPYQISTAAQLYWFAGLVNGTLSDGTAKNSAACAKLTANITVNSNVLKSDGTINSDKVSGFTAWTPIGYYNSASDNVLYTGTFDGNGKTISGLYIEDANKTHLGLFGISSGTIKNVGVIDTYFHGHNDMGSICGQNHGTVMSCFSKSYLYGADINVGGVCGSNTPNATITNSYHIGTIYDWEPNVGGVCGYNYGGTISNCYHIGNLEHANTSNSGGVCGNNTGTITKCYYDKDICSVGGINREDALGQAEGKTTAQFTSGEVANLLQGSQSETVWGQTLGTEATPVIGGKKVNHGFLANDCTMCYTNSSVTALPPHTLDSNGFCTRCGGYQPAEKVSSTHHPELKATHNGYYAIENAGQLYWLSQLVNEGFEYMPQNDAANAVLANNIVVNNGVLTSDGSLSLNSDSFIEWEPIGLGVQGILFWRQYNGMFDGNGKTISGLYCSDSKLNYMGLFGMIEGTIKNVGIIDSYFNGQRYIGGLSGLNCGNIENCYYIGVIKGSTYVGGVCGDNKSNIENCYFAGVIQALECGGVCGSNEDNSSITNCYYLNTAGCGIANNRGTSTKVESKTLALFKSGEVAYLLQGDMAKHVWGQTIGTDDYPVIGGPKVNYGYTCTDTELGYKNEICFETPGHKYDNGFCPRCHGYQPAEKVSATHHPELNATHNGYYAIENGGQLYWLAGVVNGTIEGTSQNVAANAVLANNITVNNNVLKSDGSLSDDAGSFRVWNPIGYYSDETQLSSGPSQYVGKFDGNGKTVSGLYYNRRVANACFIGLFGAVGKNDTGEKVGNVTNVGVVDSYFNGREEIAGICGACIGANISNCYSSATVVGTALHSGAPAYNIAGICGGLIENGTVTNCYNIGQVSGTENLGGICGIAMGTITNCYNMGNIQGEKDYNGGICGLISASTVKNCYNTGQVSGSANIGGVLGGVTDDEGPNTISNCYYDNETCIPGGIDGADVTGKAVGKSTAQFGSGEVSYLLSKGYNGSIWGQKLGTDAYPILGGAKVYYGYAPDDCQHISYSNTTRTETPNHTYDNGFCTICDGYQPAIKVDGNYAIENAGQLYWFADQVNNYYKDSYMDGAVLVADITVNKGVLNSDGSLSANSSSFRPWPCIGYWTETQRRVLYGTFDGNGHIISGLYCNDATKDYTGLVGYGNGTIQNLGVVDSYFKGKDYVGSICGYNLQGNIVNCYSVSSVAGTSNAGSICGYNNAGEIANCYYDNDKCSIGGVNGADVSGKTVGKSADKFLNGEVAYQLAHADENETWGYEIWGQQLGTDPYPVGSDYKLVPTALKSEDNTYWATFSDQDYDVTLSVPSTRTLKVYNATVSGGTMSLTRRTDNQVAFGEGVLLKTDGEYVNVKENDTDGLTKVDYTYNNLVATPFEAETITADAGYTLYRLTYNNVSKKEGLGFYLGVVKDEAGNVTSSDGSQLKATPGKAYLKVANSEVKTSPSGAAVRAFVFPDNDEDITGIECITVSDDELRGNGNNSIHDLGGRRVSDSSKGVVVKRGKKVIKN